MSQVIMMFLVPIGLYFYFFVERKERPAYRKVFEDFQTKIQKNTMLNNEVKIKYFKDMLENNDYKIVALTPSTVRAEKRILSMSLLAVSFGVFYVGLLVYLVYVYWIQKPDVVEFEI